jgi:hypothetical protein
MTTLTDEESAARLLGATKAWAEALRPAVRAIDGLSDRPHSRPVREALVLAAEHVRIAAVLLEATADAASPHRTEQAHQMDDQALARHIRDARL